MKDDKIKEHLLEELSLCDDVIEEIIYFNVKRQTYQKEIKNLNGDRSIKYINNYI